MNWNHDEAASVAGIYAETSELGDMIAARYRIPAGTDPAPYYRGFPDQDCPCEHWCYLVEGKLRYRLRDGRAKVVQRGDAYHLPPGHIAEALEDSLLIEFSRTDDYRRKLSHLSHAQIHYRPEPEQRLGPLANPRPGYQPRGPEPAA